MHNDARQNVANCVRDYLEATDIQFMRSSPRGPDLNPIEHLLDELGKAIRQLPKPLESLVVLRTALV